jgi:hypothetical protein
MGAFLDLLFSDVEMLWIEDFVMTFCEFGGAFCRLWLLLIELLIFFRLFYLGMLFVSIFIY